MPTMAKQTYATRVKSGHPPLTVTLPPEVHERLKQLCEAWGDSKSGMVATAIMNMGTPEPVNLDGLSPNATIADVMARIENSKRRRKGR